MDYPTAEYEARLARAHKAMGEAGLDALFLCSEAEIRWFTGFRTLFWQSPTRPWFCIVPIDKKPIAVIPEIGTPLMAQTWIDDIRTWSAPAQKDDGLSALKLAMAPYINIGMAMGHETSLRMPLADFEKLGRDFADATKLIQRLRMIKSEAEIATHREICTIASNTFARVDELFHIGQPLSEAFRTFKIALLQAGAEDVPYLVGGAGALGYDDVISPPSDTPLQKGDVLMLDTGATLRGAFCDFDRNFAFGHAAEAVKATHRTLWQATEAGLAAARPGATCYDLFEAMHEVIAEASDTPASSGGVGRYGHGLGMQLTEQPSIIDWDQTVLEEGMVMTLEPSMPVPGGGMLVHEENIVIRDGKPELLSVREIGELRVIG
ncbi:M24 family metallopeptidase [Pseudahrensia aquimaris]|uniref:M24 family metallopeptidase n=1 Tax=Pseudahrensia aquimaris TaxID=744461 RepID=A0ABW3FB25_9HYPH